jgi:5-methylcytosine-specific restriction enzyme A
MRPLKLCIECNTRHREPGPRCRSHELAHQKARNAARKHLYGGTWQATSRRARKAQPWCSICGTPFDLTLDHEHGQVECVVCNSRHRKNPA